MTPDYEREGIRLYNADCLDVLPTLEAGSVDAVVTDPPYNFSTSSSGTKHEMWGDAINSAMFFETYLRQSIRLFPIHGGTVWQFLNWRTFVSMQKAIWSIGLKLESVLVWDKQWIGPGGQRGLRPSYELVLLMFTQDAALLNRGLPDIWPCQWSSQRPNGHPAEKPEPLLARMVKETSGDTILDPFMGSGTTMVAAIREGRKAIGVEIDPKYFDIAVARIERELNQPRLPGL